MRMPQLTGKKGGIFKFIVVGIIVSLILAVNIPARLGLAGGLLSAGVLIAFGFVLRKHLGIVGVSLLVAGGLLVGQTFVTPMVSGKLSPTNVDAPSALSFGQLNDPIVRRFR